MEVVRGNWWVAPIEKMLIGGWHQLKKCWLTAARGGQNPRVPDESKASQAVGEHHAEY
jgi:hypothetical protein